MFTIRDYSETVWVNLIYNDRTFTVSTSSSLFKSFSGKIAAPTMATYIKLLLNSILSEEKRYDGLIISSSFGLPDKIVRLGDLYCEILFLLELTTHVLS